MLLTINRKHFIRLHRISPIHTGMDALQAYPTMDGYLMRINRPKLTVTLDPV